MKLIAILFTLGTCCFLCESGFTQVVEVMSSTAADIGTLIGDYGRIKVRQEKKSTMDKKNIEFYDSKGKLAKRVYLDDWEEERMSPNLRKVGVQKYGFQTQGLIIFDENGDKLVEHQRIRPYGNIYMLDDGAFVVSGHRNTQSRARGGGLAFYNSKGEMIKELIIDRLGNNTGGFFRDSSNFAFLADINNQVSLQCYSQNGEKLWDYDFPKDTVFNPFMAFYQKKETLVIKLFSNKSKQTWVFNVSGYVSQKTGW